MHDIHCWYGQWLHALQSGHAGMQCSSCCGVCTDEDDFEDSRLGFQGGTAISDDDMEDVVPAFEEGDVDISD